MRIYKVYGLVFLFFIVLGVIVFRCALGADQVFSGSDANIGLAHRGGALLPERFTGAYVSAPLLGEAVTAPLSVSNVGQWVLSAQQFSDIWYSFFLIISSVALIAYLRLWNLHWMSCMVGALSAFWVGSITLSVAGHIYKLGVMAFFSIALYLIERSIRSRPRREQVAYILLAGLCIGLMLLEQQDVGLLAGLFLGSYALFRLIGTAGKDWTRWATVLLPIALVALPLAAPTALKAYSRNVTEVGMKEDPGRRWNFVTQWSMVPSEIPDLIAPGYTGWSTGNQERPYWGICGQSPEWEETKQGFRNFRLDNVYIGVLPIFLALLGFALAMKRLKSKDGLSSVFFFLGILGIVALLLSFGKFSPLYKAFYQLPLVGNIRAPIKFLHNFQVIVGILAAFGLNRLIFDRSDDDKLILKWSLLTGGSLVVLAGITSLAFRVFSMEKYFSDWGEVAPSICNGISSAWLHAAGMAVLFCLSIFFGRKKSLSRASSLRIALLLLAAVAFDSIYLTKQYFHADNYAALKSGNPVVNYLKENQGAERVYCFSQNGVYNMWISLDFLYHDIQAFNYGQMPRMPNDYKAFLSSIGNSWHRFMQLTSSRYGLAPAQVYAQIAQQGGSSLPFVKPVSGFRFVQGNGRISTEWVKKITHPTEQVLFECTDVPPRFALFPHWIVVADDIALKQLGDPKFLPEQGLLLSDDTPVAASSIETARNFEPVVLGKINNTLACITVNSESGGILRFNQRYNPGWRVWVDGEEQALLKCNYINMGVHVPEGRHEVVFKCPKKLKPFFLQMGTILIGILLPVGLLYGKRSPVQGKNNE